MKLILLVRKKNGVVQIVTPYKNLKELLKSETIIINDKKIKYDSLWLLLKENKGIYKDENLTIETLENVEVNSYFHHELYKRIELNKIEDAKAEIDGYNIISLQNTATSIAETIEDFLGREMMKSKNFMIDEKIINKTSKKVNQMVTDLLLGRYETPNIVIPAQPVPKQKRKVKKIFIFAALGLMIYAVAHFNPELVKLVIETTKDVLKTQKITVFDDAYAWLVNFLK